MHKAILRLTEHYDEWLLDSLGKIDNTISVNIGIAQGYSLLKNYEKANLFILIWLGIYKDIDAQYNLRQQLICNYSNMGLALEAIEHIDINKELLYDYELKTLEVWCYSLLRHPKAYSLNVSLLNEPLSLSQRVETEYRMNNCECIEDFHTRMKYLMAKQHIPNHYKWLTPLKEILVGETVVLYSAGGIGDEILHLRWLKWFSDRGMNVIWLPTHECVKRLVEQMGYKAADELFELSGHIVNCFHIPYIFNLDYTEIWTGPYLKPSLEAISKFADCRGIGVRTSGNIDFKYDHLRMVELSDMSEHLSGELYSLHDDKVIAGLIDKSGELVSLDDTMGLIHNMDYVVTTCTSVAHLSCAMGKKTYVYNKVPWFSWFKHNGKMVWYGENTIVV
jgi:hypothetical protein